MCAANTAVGRPRSVFPLFFPLTSVSLSINFPHNSDVKKISSSLLIYLLVSMDPSLFVHLFVQLSVYFPIFLSDYLYNYLAYTIRLPSIFSLLTHTNTAQTRITRLDRSIVHTHTYMYIYMKHTCLRYFNDILILQNIMVFYFYYNVEK